MIDFKSEVALKLLTEGVTFFPYTYGTKKVDITDS